MSEKEEIIIPVWYTENEMKSMLKKNKYSDAIANELSGLFKRHFNAAFRKGYEKSGLLYKDQISSLQSEVERLNRIIEVRDITIERQIKEKEALLRFAENDAEVIESLNVSLTEAKSENDKLKEANLEADKLYIEQHAEYGRLLSNYIERGKEIERLKSSVSSEGVREGLVKFADWLNPEDYTESYNGFAERVVDRYLKDKVLSTPSPPVVEEDKKEDVNEDCILNRLPKNCSIYPIAGNGCEGCGHYKF